MCFHLVFGSDDDKYRAEKFSQIKEATISSESFSNDQSELVEQLAAEKLQLEKAQDELIRRVINYRKEIKELREGDIPGREGELLSERKRLREQLELARRSIQKLTDEKVSNQELVDKLARFQKKVRTYEEKNANSKNSNTVLEMKIARVKSELTSEQQKKATLMQEIEDLRKQQKQLTRKLVQTEQIQEATVSELTAKLTASANRSQELDSQVQVLAKQLEETSKKLVSRDREISAYSEELATFKEANKSLETKISFLETESKEKRELELKLSQMTEEERELQEYNLKLTKQLEDVGQRNKNYSQNIERLQEHLAQANQNIAQYKVQLQESNSALAKIPELEKSIVALENDLLMKATEQQLLGENSEDISRGRLSKKIPSRKSVSADSMLIVEVIVGKAKLRNGPGKEHGVMMNVSKGARLTVEDKLGEWYRILTPTGSRAYVSSKVVRESRSVARSSMTPPAKDIRKVSHSRNRLSSPKRISGEDAAMEFLRSSVNER